MERKGLIPWTPDGGVPASFGDVQPSGFWKRITFLWQAKLFQVGKPEDGVCERTVTFDPIFRFSGIKRNFENEYDPNAENVRPTCFSLDGKNGSVPQIARVLADGNTYPVYGECRSCKFNDWRSRGLWKPPGNFTASKAKQCAQYTMILGLYQGEVCIIQIPSTGVESVNEGVQAVVNQKGWQFEEVRWQLMGTGGGFQGKYIKIAPVAQLTGEEVAKLNLYRAQTVEQFEKSVLAFAQGGSDETTTETSEGNVINA